MTRGSAIQNALACFDDGEYLEILSRRVAIPTESQNPERQPELRRYLSEEIGPEGVQVGIGFHTAVSSGTDIYGALSYIDTKVTASISGVGSARVSEDGHAIGFGIRSRISEQIELGVGWNIVEIGDADSEQSLNFGAVFDVSDRVGLGLTIVNSDNFDAVLVGLRVYL